MIKLSDYVMQFVADQGTRDVFMLPGGGAMHLVDSLGRCSRLRYVCCLHEQGAAIAADAYAQYTNHLGVCLVTTGPGGTNAVTGVAGAWLDSVPVLFLSGQVKRADLSTGKGVRQLGFQELPIVDIVKPITKYAILVSDPADIRYQLEKSLFLARNGRPGPVWIDIPLDVQAAQIDPESLRRFEPPPAPDLSGALQDAARRVTELLAEAVRPVILAGNGVRLAGGLKVFRELAAALRVPVLTTWKAADFLPEDHPAYTGRPGAIGQRGANFALQNSDLCIILGARLDHGQTGYRHDSFVRGARKIMVDADPAELQKMAMSIDVPIVADANAFLLAWQAVLNATPPRPETWQPWLQQCKTWQTQYPPVLPEFWEQSTPVNLYALMDALSDEMVAGDLMVPGSSGQSSEVTMQAFRVKEGQRVFNTQGLGPMGFGFPAAIGGCIAAGGARTVCVDGDGGIQMNIQELETLRRLNLPVKIFVLNNQGYGSIRNTQRAYFGGHYVASDAGSGLTLPDMCKVAAAYGLATTRLENQGDLRVRVREILAAPGPCVVDVVLAVDQPTMPRLASFQRANGSMGSKPLEDLWPFLDRQEFRRNMITPPLEE